MDSKTLKAGAEQLSEHCHAEAVTRFENFRALAAFVVRKTFPDLSANEVDEFLSAAYLGLWSAARRFNPALKNSFTSYAVSMIRGYLLREYTAQKKKHWLPCVSLDAVLTEDFSRLDTIAAPALLCDPFTILYHRDRLQKALWAWRRKGERYRRERPNIEAEAVALTGDSSQAITKLYRKGKPPLPASCPDRKETCP